MNPNTLLLPNVWPRPVPTTVQRCVLLAMLLHVWLVLMLGSAPGGTALPGQGVLGSLNITLGGGALQGAADAAPPTPAVPTTGSAGTATTPRFGGAVRAENAPPADPQTEPGAARLGQWAPSQALSQAPSQVPSQVPSPSLSASLPASPRADLPALSSPPLPVLNDAVLPALQRPAPGLSTGSAPPAALPAVPNALLPELAALAQPGPAPLMPSLVAPSAAPRPVEPILLRPPVAALVQPTELPVLAEPVPPPLAPIPALSPAPSPAPSPALSPAPVPVAAPAQTAAQTAATTAVAPASRPGGSVAPTPAPTPDTASTSALGGSGAIDAGSRVGRDVATAPSQPASAPRLNLQLPRQRGGELSRGMGSGALPVLPRLPESDEKLAKDIQKAAKGDCRTAYAGAGLLAVVPLVADTVRGKDGGCKW